MKNIHIENSYKIWSTGHMWSEIIHQCHITYGRLDADKVLNRSYRGMYIEWYLHNIGFWFTYPFTEYDWVAKLNRRFQHVDLEEHRK